MAHMNPNLIPLAPPPPGQTSNFIDPPSRSNIGVIVASICVGLAWPIFCLRVYSKVFITRTFWWDDGAAIIAIIGTIAYAGGVIWGMQVFGPHDWDVPVAKFTPTFGGVETYIWGMTYGLTIFFAKMSLLLLYLRIFSLQKGVRLAVYIGTAAMLIVYFGTVICNLILCVPRPGEAWTSKSEVARCEPSRIVGYVQGAFSIISDVYIFILPIPVIWHLHLSKRKRYGVIGVFSTGLLAIISSVLSMYYRVEAAATLDNSWNTVPAVTLALVEITLAVICGCMPHLIPLFRRYSGVYSKISSLGKRLITRRSKDRSKNGYKYPSSRNKESGPGYDSSDHDNINLVSSRAPRLETNILGTMKGNGGFLKSGFFGRSRMENTNLSYGNGLETMNDKSTVRGSYE